MKFDFQGWNDTQTIDLVLMADNGVDTALLAALVGRTVSVNSREKDKIELTFKLPTAG